MSAAKSKNFVKLTQPVTSVVFDTYWKFAVERQEVYHGRLKGLPAPWTRDSIISNYRFTNAYRASDRVSQYLIKNVIYSSQFSARDTVFRVILFKLFNKIETWQLLAENFEELRISSFNLQACDALLTRAIQQGVRIYSAAYIMPNAPRKEGVFYKHRTHLDLVDYIINCGIIDKIVDARSMSELFEVLMSIPSIGPFLAYQFAIDLSYSEHFSFDENDFVQPGPGALHGLAKCFKTFGDYSAAELIAWVKDRQHVEFEKRNLVFKDLWGRPLHLIDCQNLFCETDKYARVAHPEFNNLTGRSRIKQSFVDHGLVEQPFFPPKWKIKTEMICSLTSERAILSWTGTQDNLF